VSLETENLQNCEPEGKKKKSDPPTNSSRGRSEEGYKRKRRSRLLYIEPGAIVARGCREGETGRGMKKEIIFVRPVPSVGTTGLAQVSEGAEGRHYELREASTVEGGHSTRL